MGDNYEELMGRIPLSCIEKAMSEAKGINVWKSKLPRKCHMCWGDMPKYRRECPICHWLIAPGCWPMRCWSDTLNHCRSCHVLIEMLKHWRLKSQHPKHYGMKQREDKSQPNVYLNFPVGVQLNNMSYVFQTKDFIWSNFHCIELVKLRRLG